MNSSDSVDARGTPSPAHNKPGDRGGAINQQNLSDHTSLSGYQKYTAKVIERNGSDYNMQHKNRGKALIFNHKIFEKHLELDERTGTDVDCKRLETVLKQLKFTVKVCPDFSCNDILNEIKSVAAENHEDNDCILIVILSHGEKDVIYARDTQYKLDYIFSQLKCKDCASLAGKPKLLFVQACQGKEFHESFEMKGIASTSNVMQPDQAGDSAVDVSSYSNEKMDVSSMGFKMPMEGDFLIACSSIPGFFSWRNKENGSWFIQSLCIELANNGKRLDILTLLTFVCQRVAIDFESRVESQPMFHQKKQMPCITTTLLRNLQFN